jgi:plastocyanin
VIRPTDIQELRTMKSRFSAVTFAFLLVSALAACSSPAASTAEPEPTQAAEESEAAATESAAAEESEAAGGGETVSIDNSVFAPSELTIAAGTEVTFENADSFGHTVTEGTDGTPVDDPIVDEDIGASGTVSVVFDEPGTYEITCRIHPSMQMTITVEG